MKRVSFVNLTLAQSGRNYVVTRKSTNNRFASSTTKTESADKPKDPTNPTKRQETLEKLKKTHKSMAELDEDMKRAMEGMSGDGGEAGLELEGGVAVSMKRSVRENMFRYI